MADPTDPIYKYSVNEYLTDGVKTAFEISFAGGYLSRDYIKVKFTDSAGDIRYPEFAFIGDFQIAVSPALEPGGTLMIYRDTPVDQPIVDFQDGAIINEVSLDINAKQAVHLAAEAKDVVGSIPELDALTSASAALAFAGSRANHTGVQGMDTVTGLPELAAANSTYPSASAGIAATAPGLELTVDNGDGTVTVYLNDGGVAVEQRTLATTAALASTDPGKGGGMVWLQQPGSDAKPRPSRDMLIERVSLHDYNTLQSSVAEIVANGGGVLDVPGATTLTSPLVIDRLVDATSKDMILRGTGRGAALLTATATNLFDTTLSTPTAPRSEALRVQDMTLGATSAALGAYVANDKFLRVSFENVRFEKIGVVNATRYLQSWSFLNSHAWRWQGDFYKTTNTIYDFRMSHCRFEAGGVGISGVSGWGVSVMANLFEGSVGPFVKFSGVNGAAIIGNYTENNAQPDYVLADVATGGVSRGVLLGGNSILSPTPGAAVLVGDTTGVSVGNSCTGEMFDLTGTKQGLFASFGDYCSGVKFSRAGLWEANAVGVLPQTQTATAYAGGGQANAVPLTKALNRVTTVATVGDSVCLLPTSLVTAAHGMTQVVINDGANALNVFYHPSDITNWGPGGGRATAFVLQPGAVGTFISSTGGQWRFYSNKAAAVADASGTVTDAKFNELLTSLRNAGLLTP